MDRKMRIERLDDRRLMAGDILGNGVGDIGVVTTVEVSTGFEFLNGPGDRSDLVDFRVGTSDVFVDVTGRAGTRGVPPAYNNGAFALGIGEPVTLDFSVPVDVEFALREITELTPDVVGGVVLVDSDGNSTLVEADDAGAEPPQSGDWDVIRARDIVLVQLFTANGITNIDDLRFRGTGPCPTLKPTSVEVTKRQDDDVRRSDVDALDAGVRADSVPGDVSVTSIQEELNVTGTLFHDGRSGSSVVADPARARISALNFLVSNFDADDLMDHPDLVSDSDDDPPFLRTVIGDPNCEKEPRTIMVAEGLPIPTPENPVPRITPAMVDAALANGREATILACIDETE